MPRMSDTVRPSRRWWRNVVPGRLLRGSASLWDRVVAWLEERDWDEGTLLMALGAVIGVVAGIGVVVFYRLIDLAYFVLVWLGARLPEVAQILTWPIITALGLWTAWWLVRRAGLRDGQNVPDIQLAVARRGGRVPGPPVLVRTLAAAITLGAGGSAGSEGPVAVLGAATGSSIGRGFRFQQRRVKILVGCGAAAGIAGAFNAPFAGAFFALEEVLGSFSVGAFSPVVVASVVGALTVRPFLGQHPAFVVPHYGETPAAFLVFFAALGVACGLASALYVRTYFAAADAARRMRGPEWLRPVLGGLAVGAIVIATGGLLVGNGHLAIPSPVFGGIAWYLLVGLALAKILATAATLGFGGSGGVFTPTLFVGAALGGGFGRLLADVLPAGTVHPETWALVGMAGLVAGATRAPLTAIFMVFELTDDYAIVPPLMLVAVISYAVSRRYAAHGLYDGWLARRGAHLAHGADRALMDRILARDALDRQAVTVDLDATLEEIVAATQRARHTTIPVVDREGGTLVGVITYEELKQVMLERDELGGVVLAADLAGPAEVVTPQHSLRDALRKMNARALDVLPVVESERSQRFVGVVSRADVLAAYERELVHQV